MTADSRRVCRPFLWNIPPVPLSDTTNAVSERSRDKSTYERGTIMRKLILAMLLMCGTVMTFADAAKWTDNFPQAVAGAKKEKKPILMLFTGSDWCPYCIRMDEEAFAKPQFAEFLNRNFVLFKADFPKQKQLLPGTVQQNNALARKYGIEGFPTVLVISADGKVLAKTGYLSTTRVDDYIKHYEAILKKIK